jgi:hypothetical protein
MPSRTRDQRKRLRRRLALWLGLGVLAALMGAVWATGFAEIGGSAGSESPAAVNEATGGDDQPSQLQGRVTAGSPFTVNWSGRWGSNADTLFFTVDLADKPAAEKYNVAFMLSNSISNAGWQSLQLRVENADVSSPASCTASLFDGTKRPKVMPFDTEDAGVYWNNLDGGKKYCIGLNASNGRDANGTFLRRANASPGTPSVYPSFIASVSRAS